MPTDFVDPSWDAEEKALVLDHLQTGTALEHWKGYSWCRFGCDHKTDEQGTTDRTDGTYAWPEGFAPYIKHHHVRPPQEFVDHIRNSRDAVMGRDA